MSLSWDGLNVNELGFLYKKCKIIRPGVISLIGLVPEYMEPLKMAAESGVYFDDYVVFRIIQKSWDTLRANGREYRTARQAINAISKDIYGDPHAWEYK